MKKIDSNWLLSIAIIVLVIAALIAGVLAQFIVMSLSLFLYFLPSILAQKKKFFIQVFLTNFFFGWTFIGWVIALIWSVKEE